MPMGPWTRSELIALAHPYPVRWLFPRRPGDPRRVVNLFAGPGGWEQGMRILSADPEFDAIGIEIVPGTAATATAAGHQRIVADVRTLDLANPALRDVEGLTVSAPCGTWTPAGKREGHLDSNIELLLEVFTRASEASFGHWHDNGACEWEGECGICDDPSWDGYNGYTGPLRTLAEVREPIAEMTDPSVGLIAETLIWTLTLSARYDNLRWMAMEQSSALPQDVLSGMRDELDFADWCSSGHEVLDAADVGLASHRRRTFLIAGRHHYVNLGAMHPTAEIPKRTAAEALGWPSGIRVNTRGNRKTSGGNEWSADRTANSVTSKYRTAYWAHDPQRRFTVPETGLLLGVPVTHPWNGSRSAIFQQQADLVPPTEAARVLGALLQLPWEEPVTRYLDQLYGPDNGLAEANAQDAHGSTRSRAAVAQSDMLPGLDSLSGPVSHGTGANQSAGSHPGR